MSDTTLERMASAMRDRYAEHSGDRDIVPWEQAKSRDAWMVCARAALEAIREPSAEQARRIGLRDYPARAAWMAQIDNILRGA